MLYQKRPVLVEARQLTDANGLELADWCDGSYHTVLIIHTLEGDHRAEVGDWIIKGVEGEFYPCKPDIFEKTYKPA